MSRWLEHVDPEMPPRVLRYASSLEGTEWIRDSLTTFATSVASFVPSGFEAYARIYHPWQDNVGSTEAPPRWRDVARFEGFDLEDPIACAAMPWSLQSPVRVMVGSLERGALDAVVEHVRIATSTADDCWFALWEGFGDAQWARDADPRLVLPNRSYLIFRGPLDGARVNLSDIAFSHRSPSLWWPADHAWCVATEVDHAWSYVGGSRALIDDVLADARLESIATTADLLW